MTTQVAPLDTLAALQETKPEKVTIVLPSGDFDRAMAAFIITTGAAAMEDSGDDLLHLLGAQCDPPEGRREFSARLTPSDVWPSPLPGLGQVAKADVTLDTLGLFCPMSIIHTSKKLKELTVRQILEVVSADEGIKKDMPAWCETTEHELVGIKEDLGENKPVHEAFVKKNK